MSLTLDQLNDELFAPIKTVADAQGIEMKWPDMPDQDPPTDNTKTWARVVVQYSGANQVSLSNENGVRKWGVTGFIIVQLFAPIGDGGKKALSMVNLLMNSFRSANSPVWFRNPRPQHVGEDGAFTQKNLFVNFEYNQLQ